MHTQSKQGCYDVSTKALYQGPCCNYDFSTDVHTHKQAQQELIRLREPVPENKKAINYIASVIDMVTKNTNMTTASQISGMNSSRGNRGGGRGACRERQILLSRSRWMLHSWKI